MQVAATAPAETGRLASRMGMPGLDREVLYESQSSRVYRLPGHGAVVAKQALGRGANERLRHEKDILARLQHVPGVARLVALPDCEGLLLMEDGGTAIADWLGAGEVETGALLALARELAATLAEVHRAGVIHRHITPANVLQGRHGRITLIDFDLASSSGEVSAGFHHQNAFAGTMAYMAPEQSGRTSRAMDHRADLYGLGVLLYELACGRRPFASEDPLELMHAHLARIPVAPCELRPGLPRPLSDMIMRLLEKEPGKRYQSAEGVASDIDRLRQAPSAGPWPGFELAQNDFGHRLLPPSRPVGRDRELSTLDDIVDAAVRGETAVALIAGPAGVGKTSLLNELRPLVSARGGWLVSATFHQHRRDAYASTGAMRALGRLLLAEPEEQFRMLRERILQALGSNLGLGATQLPEFQLLLGKHSIPEISDAREAEARINQSSIDLMRSVGSAGRPLVMVLDELQWAPSITVRFLEAVAAHPDPAPGVLVVAAYRTEDVKPGDPLDDLLRRWSDGPRPPRRIELGNLAPEDLARLLEEMLRISPPQARTLAEPLHERTDGNPHDAIELTNALRQEGLLQRRDGRWHWEGAEVRAYVGECSVPELLARRLAALPGETRSSLEAVACLGGAVRAGALAAALGVDPQELQASLAPALRDGMLVSGEGQGLLRFRHRLVQDVVVAGMDEHRRIQMHLDLARRLIRDPELQSLAAGQYLPAATHIDDRQERRSVALLFQREAGLAGVLSFSVSDQFLRAAIGLLEASDDRDDLPSLRQLLAGRHQVLYGMGRLEEADAVYARLVALCDDPVQLVQPAGVQIYSLVNRSRPREAMAIGVGLLGELGISRPRERGGMLAALKQLAQWYGSDQKMRDYDRPLLDDPRLLGAASLLLTTANAAYFADQEALAWLALEGHRLWTEHGPCAQLISGGGTLAALMVNVLDDRRGAHAAACHLISVGEARRFEPGTSIVRFCFALYVAHWLDPLEEVVRHHHKAREDLLRAGDVRYACYTYAASDLLFDCASSLEAARTEIEAGLAFAAATGQSDFILRHLPRRQLLRSLCEGTSSPGAFSDAEFDEAAHAASAAVADSGYHILRAVSAAIFGDTDTMARHTALAMPLQTGTPGYYILLLLRTLHGLSLAEQLRCAPPESRTGLLAELDDDCLDWLKQRAADAPRNCLHLLRWLEAERACAVDGLWVAGAAFDAAMEAAALNCRPWHLALITERAGLFHLDQGLDASGRALLARARELYADWGATAKVRHMESQHAFLQDAPGAQPAPAVEPAQSVVGSDAMDLLAVARASQSLSSETSLPQLRRRVIELLRAMTGASQVLMALWHEEGSRWMLQPAEDAPDQAPLVLEEAGARGLLPLAALRYAERTRQPLLVDDALRDDRFATDPYVQGLQRCSLLVVPILSKGAPRAMLVLENRLTRGAFSAARLDALMLIAGQLAVSLENALLYEELEQRVQQRTSELRAAQTELIATARRAGMAEIATNVLHNVGNVLNSVNVSAALATSRLRGSKLQGLARAVRMMEEHAGDLAGFLTHDEKGRLLPTYLARAVDAVGAEHLGLLEELANLTRSIDHIKAVVATQQSHAGSSSLYEQADLAALVEDALRINSVALDRSQVVVVRQFDPVPIVQLDKTRVLGILVNLIKNGVQAMSAMEGERQLTLRLERHEDKLRLRVSDEGVGIAPEHLTRIFTHGFTTRQAGHGFGLHSCSLAARQMGGTLAVHSEGPGRGASFTLDLPLDGKPLRLVTPAGVAAALP